MLCQLRGHFSTHFGSQEDSLSCFNQSRWQFSVLCQLRGHFSVRFGSQVGSLSCFNQPRGQFSVLCQPRGHLSAHFGSQEGTLACIFQQLGHDNWALLCKSLAWCFGSSWVSVSSSRFYVDWRSRDLIANPAIRGRPAPQYLLLYGPCSGVGLSPLGVF